MKQLLLLHGALGSEDQFDDLKRVLSPYFEIFTLNFYGHGTSAPSTEPLRIEAFSEQVLEWLEKKQINQIAIFGYSMGGFVALHLAANHPEKVSHIFTLGTKFNWTPETAAHEVKMLDPKKIEAKVPAFGEDLAKRHGKENWQDLLYQTAEMMQDLARENPLTPESMASIEIPVLVSVGDRDTMVTLEETVRAFKQLKNASLLVLPHTNHPLDRIDRERIVFECRQFFE